MLEMTEFSRGAFAHDNLRRSSIRLDCGHGPKRRASRPGCCSTAGKVKGRVTLRVPLHLVIDDCLKDIHLHTDLDDHTIQQTTAIR